MKFFSILYLRAEDRPDTETSETPDCFIDLNLDQIVDKVTASRKEYNLKPFFFKPLADKDSIMYRQEVMRELENAVLREKIIFFADKIRTMNRYLSLARKIDYKYNSEGWMLEAIAIYCDAVKGLTDDLSGLDLKSRGFLALREYVEDYAKSSRFLALQEETLKCKADLATVRYCLLIRENCVKVRKYESEIDYSSEVERTFEKFKQGAVKDYRVKFSTDAGMNHIEAKIVELVARLYPDIFQQLDDYCTRHDNYIDETIAVFGREIHFYIAWLEYISTFRRKGLLFCYPEISDSCKEIYDYEGFDLALAGKLIAEGAVVVCNDFLLKDPERIFVVSGPNQGGKTTFARTFGQLHYLAAIGCPVPGREAKLFLFDRILTHFEKAEKIENLRGKLQDDLFRIHSILDLSTSRSIVIMNEIFTSTTVEDGIFLSKKILKRIMSLDLLCVYVTFMVELASLSEKTVSMVSAVEPENPAARTYKIVRKPADGLSYALTIAEKYRLTYDQIKERIRQ